jgi:hypothetical protein
MNQSETQLPSEYVPYSRLELCSNKLEGVAIPLLVRDTPLLLIGRGATPLVWLSAPTDPSGANWDFVVAASLARNPAVRVQREKSKHVLTVRVSDTVVAVVEWKGLDSARVTRLDLRPVGLNVVGDTAGLRMGGMTMSGNTVVNARVAFALGG